MFGGYRTVTCHHWCGEHSLKELPVSVICRAAHMALPLLGWNTYITACHPYQHPLRPWRKYCKYTGQSVIPTSRKLHTILPEIYVLRIDAERGQVRNYVRYSDSIGSQEAASVALGRRVFTAPARRGRRTVARHALARCEDYLPGLSGSPCNARVGGRPARPCLFSRRS